MSSFSLQAEVYSILTADAQVSSTGSLGGSTMLNQASTAPFGLYRHYPPAEPVTPFLVYREGVGSGEHPTETAMMVTAFGRETDNIITIQDRVHALLHRKQLLLDVHRFLQLAWDWHSDEIWHDEMELYSREDRFIVKSWKESNVSI